MKLILATLAVTFLTNVSHAEQEELAVPNCLGTHNLSIFPGRYSIKFKETTNNANRYNLLFVIKHLGFNILEVDYKSGYAIVDKLGNIFNEKLQTEVTTVFNVLNNKNQIESIGCVGLIQIRPRIGVAN